MYNHKKKEYKESNVNYLNKDSQASRPQVQVGGRARGRGCY